MLSRILSILGCFLLFTSIIFAQKVTTSKFGDISDEMTQKQVAALTPNKLALYDVNNPEIPKELVAEKAAAAKIEGLNYFNIGSDQVPKPHNLEAFFKVMDNPANYPVLIHCFHGVGRAEMYSAIYRIEYENWDRDEARTETRLLTKFSSFDLGKPKGDFLHNYVSRKEKKE